MVGLVLMLVLSHLVKRTTLGKAMRATAQDADAARMMGIDVDRVVVLTFFLGSALAGAGSLFFGLYYGFTAYYIGYTTGLRAFTSAVLGGIGSIPGAVLGGLCIGLTQSLGGQLLGVKWTDVIIFSILIVVMVFRPNGLLGARAAAEGLSRCASRASSAGARCRCRGDDRSSPPCSSGVGLAFPVRQRPTAGNVDAAANAFTYVLLALGLNIVVGFAGLLDLGYAAFFAIGAYGYGIVASGQLKPEWSSLWVPLEWARPGEPPRRARPARHRAVPLHVLADAGRLRHRLRDLRHAVRRPDAAAARRLPRHRDARLRRDRAGRRAQLGGAHQRRPGAGRHPHAQALRLRLRLLALSVLLPRARPGRRRRCGSPFACRSRASGRAWMAIREDELAAGAMGVNHVHYKLLAFAMGAAIGGLGGTFYVAKLTTATPDMFTFPVSVMVLVMVVLGGLGSIRGVVLAALLVAFLQSVILQDLTEYVHALGRLVGQ